MFVSEELTVWFKSEPQAVHVLCYGITPTTTSGCRPTTTTSRLCAAYLHEREITCALAHPFYAVRRR